VNPVVSIPDVPGQDSIELVVPRGAHAVTPASRIAIRVVAEQAGSLRGVGIDWGTGTGGLAIAAARHAAVERVYAIDVDRANLEAANVNAERNGAGDKVVSVWANGFTPQDDDAADALREMRGAVEFVVANPPGSDSGDGLDWRRLVLEGGATLVADGAPALIQISRHYGPERIAGLAPEGSGWIYDGVVATTGWDPFDLARTDLAELMERCVAVESSGGVPYRFGHTASGERGDLTAVEAFEVFRITGESPLTQWQVHRFRRQ